MSQDIIAREGLVVSTLCGPESLGHDRMLWQFTTPLPLGYTQLTRDEVLDLVDALIWSARVPEHLKVAR